MRRITIWALSTISALVLLLSYHTSTNATGAATVVATDDAGTASGETGSGTTDPGSSRSETFTGDAISTRFGDVQVEITVQDGTITSSRVVQVPWNDHKDQVINSRAVPILNEEAVASQSADIDMVSGATYTSEGYIASLQSAIDQANR